MKLEVECPATQEGRLLAMPRKRKTPTPADETVGQRLARLRKARGFSQIELGELLGVRPVKGTPAPRNTRLWRKLRDVEKLPLDDRKAVLKFVDALLVRQRVAGGSR